MSPRLRMEVLKPIQLKSDVDDPIQNGEKGQPLSPIARLSHQPDSCLYIIIMIGIKTKLNPQAIKADLVKSLLKQPRFCSLLVEDETVKGGIKWVQTKVNLDNHVIVPKLDPNNIDSPDKFVDDYISNLSKTKIKMSMPLWDIHVLNLKTCDAESVAVLRLHHSLGDGTSLMSLFLAYSRKISNPNEPPTIPVIKRANPSSSSGTFWGKIIKLWNTLVDVLMFLATSLSLLKDTKTPLKGPLSQTRRFVRRSLSLDDVKLVKKTMNATINDVMLGVTQAGLSRYLNRKYGECDKSDKGTSERSNNLPHNIRLRAALFVNLRKSPGIQKLDYMMKKGSKARWGNEFGYLFYPFTIALRDDPLDYLREAKATMDRKKASLETSFSYFLAKCFLKLGSVKRVSFPTETTVWFSNIPGPGEEISFYGYPVAYIAPSCYGQPTGLLIHVISYGNKITFVLSIDEGIIPDPNQLCDDLEESFNLIKTAALAKAKFTN